MVKSDILLDDKNVDAIPADGSFNLTTGTDEDPDIRLTPNQASLELGDGDGDDSVGIARLLNDDGDATVKLDAETSQLTLSNDGGTETASLDGQTGRLHLGNGSADASGTVKLENADGTQTATLASDQAEGAALNVAHQSSETTADIQGGTGTLTLGNGDAGVDGTIDLVNSADETTVNVESERSSGGAGIELTTQGGATTADIDAGERKMELGGAGVGGTILLTDGQGTTFELTVEDDSFRLGSGNVAMRLEPNDGIFSIVDGEGEAAFQIDTQRQTIKKNKKYTGGAIGHGS